MTPSSKSSAMCQCFAVLEDGVLAHNLQEQEIEQYYTTNIQKNQLVQNDIRVAKRLQDEEEEQWTQQSALLRQASRQLEEQDLEYARVIQEEILRRAEEAQRREQDDEEIAKRMQEEEKQRNWRRSRGQEGHSDGNASDPALSSPHQHTLHHGEEQYSYTTRWQCSTSHDRSDLTEPQAHSPRRVAAQKSTTSWSNQGRRDSFRAIRNELREPLSEDSEDSDTVFSEQLSVLTQRLYERLKATPPRRQASLHQVQERTYRSLSPRSSFTDELRVCEEERGKYDYYENGDLEKRRPRNWDQEMNHREEYGGLHRSRDYGRDSRVVEVSERRCSRSESVRLHDRSRHNNRDLARTWSYKDNPDKHVRFQDDTRRSNKQGESSSVWEMLGQVLMERGVPVRFGSNGAPLQIRPQSRDSQVLHGSEVSCSDSQPHQRAFQRAASTRHSFHGDIRERRRLSYRENSGRDHREDRDRRHNIVEHDGEVYEISRRDSYLANSERGGSARWRERRCTNDDERERNVNDRRVKRTTSERRHWHRTIEERLSSEEEQEVERRRREQPRRRAPQRSQSLRCSGASTRDRSRHMAAGASLQPDLSEASLDLGELQQVLQDEELARKLQGEEEKLLRRNSQSAPCSSYPEGDFRVAQVAQDEEIAHFMQKQEIKSKRRSRELEGLASLREHRAMVSHDRRAARDRQVQRERLDSEGLPSPTEDCSPENQPPSPTSTIPQAQQIRNIAEELDPTFQARRQGTESLRVGQTGPTCQSLPMSHSGLHDFLEEPTFIPPTKRQTDKSGRTKPKEKKENCKQQ
ncbi:coiled-coil domain-containing protein 187 isoform X2 [Chelmon rostratus]|uniref:coiled-coil domain-containing protein 187 isoform X2 n=1 Tax=Chelmon rostratus TaxID=109905 RepID=UPI001BE58A56|nr:coiled-coil domain-containing protein 187 isoform X2 [Chelmon rostratus]